MSDEAAPVRRKNPKRGKTHAPEARARAHALYREYKAQGLTRFMGRLVEKLNAEGFKVSATALANWRVQDKWNDEATTIRREQAVMDVRLRATLAGADMRDLKTLTGAIEGLTQTAYRLTEKVTKALETVEPTTVAEVLEVAKAATVIMRQAMDMRLAIIGHAPADLTLAPTKTIDHDPAPSSSAPTSVTAAIAVFEKGRKGVQSH